MRQLHIPRVLLAAVLVTIVAVVLVLARMSGTSYSRRPGRILWPGSLSIQLNPT